MEGGDSVRASMRRYWDERARLNPAWYVDTSLDYAEPDMAAFAETGRTVVRTAVDEAPVSPPRRERAVEIGCGLGRICAALADSFSEVLGVDISPEMVQRARAEVHDPRVNFAVTDGATLTGVPDASVDFVLSFTVFQHIPSRAVIDRYVRETGRVLRPGGVFALQWNSTPGALRWRWRRRALALVPRSGRGDRWGRDAPAFLGERVPLNAMRVMFDRAGLRMAAVRDPGQLFTWAWGVRLP